MRVTCRSLMVQHACRPSMKTAAMRVETIAKENLIQMQLPQTMESSRMTCTLALPNPQPQVIPTIGRRLASAGRQGSRADRPR